MYVAVYARRIEVKCRAIERNPMVQIATGCKVLGPS